MRYRMRFLEKEAFDYLPDITKELLQIQKTTTTIHTHTEHEYEYEYEYTDLYDLFGFTKKEREIIGNFMKQQHFEINLNDQVL
tara:strand:- start:335 stop:583 length:249 start_codon:yes stop_codon:yes gene_type:complete